MMKTPRHRKAMGWGYGVGLLALMVTVVIGLYLYAKSIEPVGPAYKKVQKQAKDIEKTLNERNANLAKDYGLDTGPRKDRYAVVLLYPGDRKEKVAEAIQSFTKLTPAQARDLVQSAPKKVKDHLSISGANAIRKVLEDLGAGVDVKDELAQDTP